MLNYDFVSRFDKNYSLIERIRMRKTFWHLIIVVFLGFLGYFFQPAFVADMENRILDYRFASRGKQAPDSRVVIIGIDQNSLSQMGLPFFTFGSVFAEAADAAVSANAAGLLFDVVFPASSEKAIKDHVASISRFLKLDLPHRFYRELGFEREFRASLIRVKKSETKLVIGFAWEKDQEDASDKIISRIAGEEGTGYFNLPVDPDGKIRRALLYKENGKDEIANSVAMLGAAGISSFVPSLGSEKFRQINYCGPLGTFKTIPLIKLLESHRKGVSLAEELQGKILLLGFTDITDFKSTPFGYMPGVEIHANIIDNILNRRFLAKLDLKIEIILVCLLTGIILLFLSFNQLKGIIAGITFALIWSLGSYFFAGNTMVPLVRPVFVFLLFSFLETLRFFQKISQDRKRIKSIFGRYVSDSVLNEILSSSDQDFISGKRRHLCILFADIRGFTSFSEKREAAEVVEFLNSYFAKLTSIIMKHNGVVDKFLGDGLLAFYNAPVEKESFVSDAVRSAMEICEFSNSEEFRISSGDKVLNIGVALHVGPVVFGNIGSEKKAEFTVIGDAVNTCSRMESLNKEFGTSLIVSEDVVKECDLSVEWRPLESKTLRGKSEKINLYTIA